MQMQMFAAMLMNVSPDSLQDQCLELKNEPSALLTLRIIEALHRDSLLSTRGQQDSQQISFLLL